MIIALRKFYKNKSTLEHILYKKNKLILEKEFWIWQPQQILVLRNQT